MSCFQRQGACSDPPTLLESLTPTYMVQNLVVEWKTSNSVKLRLATTKCHQTPSCGVCTLQTLQISPQMGLQWPGSRGFLSESHWKEGVLRPHVGDEEHDNSWVQARAGRGQQRIPVGVSFRPALAQPRIQKSASVADGRTFALTCSTPSTWAFGPFPRVLVSTGQRRLVFPCGLRKSTRI